LIGFVVVVVVVIVVADVVYIFVVVVVVIVVADVVYIFVEREEYMFFIIGFFIFSMWVYTHNITDTK